MEGLDADPLINQFGLRDASNIDGQDCCDVVVAAKVIELVGKRMAYIRNRYSFTVSHRYIRILPGTIVTITDPTIGLDHIPVRVTSIGENEKGELAITSEEYPGTLGISRPVANPGVVAECGRGRRNIDSRRYSRIRRSDPDQRRSPQPTPAILEDNPVTFQRPATGPTYVIEDPSDGTLAANSVEVRGPSGLTIQFVYDGKGLGRCIQ